MPVDFEMLLSASPPLFSQSALADFHFAYNHRNMPTRHHSQHSSSLFHLNTLNGKGNVVTSPIRPILIIKTVSSPETEEMPDFGPPTSPNSKDKKKVWFADDKGLALTHVRIMAEPSNCPPRWTDSFMEHVTRGAITCGGLRSRRRHGTGSNGSHSGNGGAKWRVMFPQPASDYVAFRQKLEREFVSLENVIVRDDGEEPSPLITGTLKVKNLAFDKEVKVRFTFDRWLSHQDVKCTFVPSGLDNGAAAPQYDTFSFAEPIPATADKFQAVEFCVCFICDCKEYWDSNGGTNYKLVLVKDPEVPIVSSTVPDAKNSELPAYQRFADPVKANFDRWTEFASWNHLVNDSPYW